MLSKECVRSIQTEPRRADCTRVDSRAHTPLVAAVPAGLRANIRTIPAPLLWHNRWSGLAGKSGINHGLRFRERLPLLPQISELSQWYLLIPSKPGVSLAARKGRRVGGHRALPYWHSQIRIQCVTGRDSLAAIWEQAGKAGRNGVSASKNILCQKTLIAESTHDKEWRCQKRKGCFWASVANRCLQSFHEFPWVSMKEARAQENGFTCRFLFL